MHIISVFVLSWVLNPAHAQDARTAEAQFDSAYAVRIQLEEINGIYIPENLGDAFAELTRLTSPKDLEKFRNMPESLARDKLHFSLGRWMIHNWGFYEGSRLSHYLKGRGLTHPDDMAKVLLVSLHRHLNQVPLNVDEQINFYQELRDQERLDREQKKEVIHEETRTRKKNR